MLSSDQPTTSTPQSGRRIAVTRSCPSQDRIVQPEFLKPNRRRASSSSSTSKRRSVSSMNGLMPFALSSPAGSTASSPSPPVDRVANKVDGYFPEVLAKDLERSSSAFSSRSLTSGAPDAQLSLEDVVAGPSSAWPQRSVSSPYHSVAGRPLVPIQERNSVADFVDYNDPNYDGNSSDLDSMSGTEVSRNHAAPSFCYREQSVITAATSLTSSCWQPSPRNSPAFDAIREHSWIEQDSEDDDDHEIPDQMPEENLASLSPRPPTPPESDDSAGSADTAPTIPMSSHNKRFHRKSYSIGGGAPVAIPRRRQSSRRSQSTSQSPLKALASSPNQWQSASGMPSHSPSSPAQRHRSSSLQTPGTQHQHLGSPPRSRMDGLVQHPRTPTDDRTSTHPVPFYPSPRDEDDESVSVRNIHSSQTVKPSVFIRPSPPPSPLPSVQSWLNASAHPYITQTQGDDLPRAVPLPPNVMETLRVSVTCFPETMLLTSSLTIETIRNYSKKVRQPGVDLASLSPDSPSDSPRRSLWKRFVSTKRQASATDRYRPQTSAQLQSPSHASLAPPKPWVSLQNVFGCASDYICDSLWAHIVAYNYISALIPRTPPQTRSGRGRSSSAEDSQKEEIPKKAASLLGLAASQDIGAGMDRMTKKLTSQLSWGLKMEGTMTEQSARSITYENATRDIQAGLMRCIMRLIATAKLMAEDGSAADRSVEVETQNVDVLFTRSLCEIVRMAEEAM